MPGIGDVIDGAMQHAPHPMRQTFVRVGMSDGAEAESGVISISGGFKRSALRRGNLACLEGNETADLAEQIRKLAEVQ